MFINFFFNFNNSFKFWILVHYQSSSPDEIALLEGAAQMGFIFKERTTDKLKLEILGKDETFEILHTFEFTSERKRMSVVCKDQTGKILLYSKGAENVMFERLDDEKQYLQETTDHLTVIKKLNREFI